MIKKALFILIFCFCNIVFLQGNELNSIITQGKKLYVESQFSQLLELLTKNEKKFENADTETKASFFTLFGQTKLQLRKHSEAEEYLLKALSFSENKETEEYASILNSLGELYDDLANYENAENFLLEAKEIREKVLGKEHPDYARSLNSLGILYVHKGDYSKVEMYLLGAKEIREKVFGKEHPDYTRSLNNLGVLYNILGDYSKAEIYWLEAKNINEKVLGKEHFEYARSLNNLGIVYYSKGDYSNSEKYWTEAKTIQEKIFGKEHPIYAALLENLGTLHRIIGDFDKAEQYLLETKEIKENFFGNEHPDFAISLNNLGILYREMGDYSKAEKYFTEAKVVREKVLGKEHVLYASSLHNLGNLYLDLGDLPKAISFILEAKQIREKVLGKEHNDYAVHLNNLAALYIEIGDFSEAENYLLETKEIFEKIHGKDHHYNANSLYGLGILYMRKGDFDKAETFFLEAKNIDEAVWGKEHLNYANSLHNLGILYFKMNEFDKAKENYLEAINIREKRSGKEHPDYLTSLNNLAALNFFTKNFTETETLKIETDQITANLVENNFVFLSERQRELFWNKYKDNFEITFSITFANPSNIITAHAYNNTLFTKGLLLRTTNKIRDVIYSSGDENLIEQYDFLKSNRLSLNALKQQENPDLEMISILETTVDNLDKSLTQKSAEYKDFNQEVKWNNIRDILQKDEVAIEFVHFRLLDDNDTFTDTILYCALLLKKDTDKPLWIPLFKESDLLELAKREKGLSDIEFTQQLYSDKGASLYNLIWKPLEKELEGIRTVYYSPSGMLHQISFAAVPVFFNYKGTQSDGIKAHKETSELLLSDQYDLQLLTSTREILRLKKEVAGSLPKGNAAIYGGLFYEPENYDNKTSSPFSQFSILNSQFSNTSERGFGIRQKFLPGTEKEAELIATYLNENQIDSHLYLYSAGSEETFKQLSGTETGIIHISTHGFFLDDIEEQNSNDLSNLLGGDGRSSKAFKNRLLRSGLMFTDSNRAWTGAELPEGAEDGILTADEIAQMNLVNTKLVVLSACETGLGEAKTAEGVFGLQRAFKLAGVETIIMSLWKVPDNATADLMTFFYQNWLTDKATIKEAFTKAQKQVREKYINPYYWAGFVMLD
ncbi:MAG: CHAT domain-containing protein [Marinilabiliaceae bacterium]|nr:CHAT domain-containing protein [Marinilabiliaceae bacterium]